jgi:hypothetical protein
MGKADGKTAEEQDRRTFVALPLAQLLPGITRPAFKKRSPAGASLMAEWSVIVGPRLAALTEPRKLVRGQLTIACNGPVAMELQHAAAVLIERINTHAGSGLVEKLRFIQDHVTSAAPVLPRPVTGAPPPVPDFPAGELNDALAALQAALKADRGR